MNRYLVTQMHFHQVGPYKSLHIVLWSVGPDLCLRSAAGVLSLWSGHVQLGPEVIIAPGLSGVHIVTWVVRGALHPLSQQNVLQKINVFLSFCQDFFFLSSAVSKLGGSLHSRESCLEAKNLNKQHQPTWKAMELAAARKILKGSLAL